MLRSAARRHDIELSALERAIPFAFLTRTAPVRAGGVLFA